MSDVQTSETRVPMWAVGIVFALCGAACSLVWGSLKDSIGALEARAARAEARETAIELEAARRYQALDGLTSEVRDMRADVRAGFEATRAQIAALSTQLTATQPGRGRP